MRKFKGRSECNKEFYDNRAEIDFYIDTLSRSIRITSYKNEDVKGLNPNDFIRGIQEINEIIIDIDENAVNELQKFLDDVRFFMSETCDE